MLVGKLEDGSDACTDAAVAKVAQEKPNAIFQSAYKMTNDKTGTSVYYLSQFVDHAIPSALSEADRLSYTKFVRKKESREYEAEVNAPGLECELLTGQAPSTITQAEEACANDDRCVGYYKSTKAGLAPVMAMAAPGNCALRWMKLADSTEPDVCTKFFGDKAWITGGGDHAGWCVPAGCDMDARTGTGMCGPYSHNCPSGWGKCPSCDAKETCRPLTEDTCPAGWVLDRTDAAYPNGLVCKPECQQTATGRVPDGLCNQYNDTCADLYGTSRYGWGVSLRGFCKPHANSIKEAHYKAK